MIRVLKPLLSVSVLALVTGAIGCAPNPPQAAPIVKPLAPPPSPETRPVEPTTLPATMPVTPPKAPEPRASVTTIGKSVEGQPIEMTRIGSGPSVILIIAGIHGDEPTGCYLAEHLVGLLGSSEHVPGEVSLYVISCANPDARKSGKRGNSHGVDINRNFPATSWRLTRPNATYSGPKAGSEPETVALIEAVRNLKPSLIVSIHSIVDGRQCNNYDGPATRPAELMSRYNHYPVMESIGYPTPGSLGTWAGKDQNIPMVTLELPREQSGEKAWSQNRDALLAVIGIQPKDQPQTRPTAIEPR